MPSTLSPRRDAAPTAAAIRLLATSLHATFLHDDAGGRLFLWTDPLTAAAETHADLRGDVAELRTRVEHLEKRVGELS